MLLLHFRQTSEDRRVACTSWSRWYALAAGNGSSSTDPSLSYRCLPYYISYPSLDFCRLYRLYSHYHHHWHPSLQKQSFWSEPILSPDCSLLFNELGDNLLRRGGHSTVFVHHEIQEDFPLIIRWDPSKEVEDVLLLTHLGDCLWIHVGLGVGSISASGQCHSLSCAEIVFLDFPIDPRCILVDISAVL